MPPLKQALNAESLCMRVAEIEDEGQNLQESICELADKVFSIEGMHTQNINTGDGDMADMAEGGYGMEGIRHTDVV